MRPLRVAAALAATVVLTVALAVTAAPTPSAGLAGAPALPPVRPTRVLVLGDSVMKGAATQYAVRLPGREVIVDAEVSRSTGAGADALDRLGTDWDVVVVLLGHNDGGTPGAYQPAVRRILDALRGVPRVSWLTIHEVRPYYPDVNRYVAWLAAAYPNLRIGDWNAVANAHPEALASDGLHLNGAGADLMADLVGRQVEEVEFEWGLALRRLAATTTTTSTTTTTAPPTTTSTSTSTTTTRPTNTTTTTTTAAAPTRPDADRADQDDADRSDDGGNAWPWVIALGALAVAGGTYGLRRRGGREVS